MIDPQTINPLSLPSVSLDNRCVSSKIMNPTHPKDPSSAHQNLQQLLLVNLLEDNAYGTLNQTPPRNQSV
jgi:hypothetical protein